MIKSLLVAGYLIIAASGYASSTISLGGEWRLDYFPQPDGGAIRELPINVDYKTVVAQVPGNCELDLVRAGVLPQPEIGLNIMGFREYEGYQWLYTRSFTAPAVADGERAMLKFAGIDTLADVFLNGEKIGSANNMLIPYEFDITRRLKLGENVVQVLIRSAAIEAQFTELGELGFSMGSQGGVDGESFRKAAHMGGWDIFPRAFVSGLWRDVTVEIQDPVRIDQTAWMVRNLTKDRAEMLVHFRVQAPFSRIGKSKLQLNVLRNGKAVATLVRDFNHYHNAIYFNVDKPDLWWPKGMGDPALYDGKLEVLDSNGLVLAAHVDRIGIRTIKLERDDVYGHDRKGQFLFRVNNEPCYVRGSNWVPLDSFHSRDRQFLIPTLELFDDLNCNMIRIWGGGVYEPQELYDYCDEHGIMIWQDFMTGCSVFPQTDEYAKVTEQEVRSIVTSFRNHASLALWSGNNENDMAFRWHLGPNLARDPNLDRNSRITIPNVLFDLDVMHDYLPSSPYYSPDVYSGKAKPSEDHLWGARAYYKTNFYTNSPCWFASEMGYHGCPNRESLEKMMSKDCVYPWKKITGKDPYRDYQWNDEWQLKASNPYLDRNNSLWRRNSLMTNQAKLMFGDVPTELDDFIYASQFVQSEALKTFVELFRAGKFTKKNGLVWWNVRDGWPQLSDAVVDYYGGKKRAYYTLKNIQQDQLVCVTDDHCVHAVNDTLKPVKGKVEITDRVSGKVVLEKQYDVPANSAIVLGSVNWEGQGVLDIVYEQGGQQSSNWFLYGTIPFDFKKVKGWFR